jgi:hypothetical protein
MPIYMDRHDMEGATAKAVADAHQKDLKGFDQPLRIYEVQWQTGKLGEIQ